MLTRMPRHLSVISFAAIFVLAHLSCADLGAQNISTAQLSGTVHDPSGAVVSGAVVTVEDVSKGFSRSTSSDSQDRKSVV